MNSFTMKMVLLVIVIPCPASNPFQRDDSQNAANTTDSYVGLPLALVISKINTENFNIIYSSLLIRPDMKVKKQPKSNEPLEMIREILMAHELRLVAGPEGSWLVISNKEQASSIFEIHGTVKSRQEQITIAGVTVTEMTTQVQTVTDNDGHFSFRLPHERRYELVAALDGFFPANVIVTPQKRVETDVVIRLDRFPYLIEEIVVAPSQITLLDQGPRSKPLFTSEDIEVLPRISDDLYRALSRLPGTAGGDISAKFNVRGGVDDEVLVLLDGQEIYQPFHLKDLLSVFSVFDSNAIGQVNFSSGGYPAQFGDRMSGVIELSTIEPQEKLQAEVGSSFFNKRILASDSFAEGRAQWFLSVRSGLLDLLRAFDNPNALVREEGNQDESFTFRDAQGKFLFHVNDHWSLAINFLGIEDLIEFSDFPAGIFTPDRDLQDVSFAYKDIYTWATISTQINDQISAETIVSAGELQRDRIGHQERRNGSIFDVEDHRQFEFSGLKQNWQATISDQHYFQLGYGFKNFKGSYDYSNQKLETSPLVTAGGLPLSEQKQINVDPDGTQTFGFVSYRTWLTRSLAVEMGLRWDDQSYVNTANDPWSPRLHLNYRIDEHINLRLSWGVYQQAQGIDELQVEDGVSQFHASQRSQHIVLGYEHLFANGSVWRLDAYQKEVSEPAARYENGLNRVALFLESEPDRWLIEPDRSYADGIETFIKSPATKGAINWWLGYSYSKTEDEKDGHRSLRSWDQTHSGNIGITIPLGQRWNVNFAGEYHTGWPTTSLTAHLEEDESSVPQLIVERGERNGERLPDFKRLDMRVTHLTELPRGRLTFFMEITNLLNEKNPCCVDFEFEIDSQGEVQVIRDYDYWMPIFPSLGMTYSY